jgi:hypothetical protein
MQNRTCSIRGLLGGVALVLGTLLTACGGGGGSAPAPSITIENPTSAARYETPWSDARLGGTISHASFVHALNERTGVRTEGYVNYLDGHGSWFVDVYGLQPGDNPITVTADGDGNGTRTAQARITLVRPQIPAEVVTNGLDQASTSTYWTVTSSFGGSHKIVFFADGSGRSTTGSAFSETAGPVLAFTWSRPDASSVVIAGCPTCSFQKISRIQGSTSAGYFYGEIETVGGVSQHVTDVFVLTAGSL